ncbi:uncharacterized protein CC84DRAFT_1163968 [Paraphaeosphaeria sporulosa]|uniref:Zn(2)-C6 fungal-type domain-containing protein n=1 Tax=Paraphaeosphaeria sporulosa TaxID=1460663 RepID=A0A177CCP2_9PLEO|nr:uncharacterized protein CC84DRAFT_1163968 [Paraphaeosphaeria sporulosa]OAG05424.1 hypothetical protein CC84DRAFT_1163968 [Paraphaeosphaeria sporulosa]
MSSTSAEGKVYKKRPHRKVKSGCHICKRRKIKCDELKPQCSNCHRYASECVYPAPSDSERLRPSMSPVAHSPESNGEESYSSGHDLPMRDLALMHQWSVATCYGFGDGFVDDADPWREQVPIIAQQFPFLMRGILALSALHLSKDTSDPNMRIRYLRTAAYHQDLAIPEYRSTLLDVTKENVVAVMIFSAILTIYSFAAPKDAGRSFAEGPPEWIFLHRGVGDMPSHWQSWLEHSFFERQLHRRRLQPVDTSLNPEDYRLHCLESLIASLPLEEANDIPAYEGALYWLRQAYAHTYNPVSMLGGKYALLFWIERVPQGYIDLLSLQRPCAMVLLANAAVLLKRASHFWYLDGFAEHIITEAKQIMGLEYWAWLEYPTQACGMVER